MSSASARAADASRAAAAADTSAAGEDADHDPVRTLACRDHGELRSSDLGVCVTDVNPWTQRHSLCCCAQRSNAQDKPALRCDQAVVV